MKEFPTRDWSIKQHMHTPNNPWNAKKEVT